VLVTGPTHLKSLQALELALRTGSLRAAADVLAITPAAVGQRIKALETYLGFELLTRGRSGLRPTPELAVAVEPLAAAFDKLATVGTLLDFQRVNEIHIAANSDFVELWLKPRLRSFSTRHPNIRFCINGEGDAPLRLSPADCEITFGEPRKDAGTDVLFRDFLVPIGSSESIGRVARIRRNKLEGFPLLHLDFYKDDPQAIGWPEWIDTHGHRKTAPDRGIRFQRIEPGLDAVISGAGFMICGLALLQPQFEAQGIALPFAMDTGSWTSHAYCAKFRAGALAKPQIRRFRNWLTDESRATEADLKRRVQATDVGSAH
jgi:LysR family transcriptional regulator, glycine cleavage system transcriptional activator